MANSATLLALALPVPQPTATGALNVVQDAQGFSGRISAVAGARLNTVQAPHRLDGFGFSTTIAGALVETQDAQSLNSSAGVTVTGALTVAGDAQALTGRAYLGLSATLAVTQQPQTLAAHTIGSGVLQDSQTLVGKGSVVIAGALSRVQADQTLSGFSGAGVYAELERLQADQTLVGKAGPVLTAALTALQDPHAFTGVAKGLVAAKLNLAQQDQTLIAAGDLRPFVELSGGLSVTLPVGTAPLTEWQDLTSSGINFIETLAGVLQATQATPLQGGFTVFTGLASSGMTTTVSLDLPASALSPSITFNPAALTTTPAIPLAGPGLSIGVSLAAALDLYSPTSFIIIDCGEIF